MRHHAFLNLIWAGALASTAFAADPVAPRPVTAKICLNCHTTTPGNLRGNFEVLALKSSSFQMKVDENTEVLRYDKASLKVVSEEKGATLDDTLKAIKKGHEVRVEYTEKEGVKTATLVAVKPAVKLAAHETITLDEVQKLVAMGPEKGKYFLFDSRPAPRFQEGNIPTAVNMPFPAFDKLVDKLPADKTALLIFYCSGKTCNMSPGSLAKAKKLGYTNAKVFVGGMPAWYSRSYGVIAPKSFKEAFLDKDIPAIVLDLRPDADKGTLKGAVALAPGKTAELLKQFPIAKLKPPVLVVDANGGESARTVAQEIVKAGYAGVNVLQGGFQAWQAANLPLVPGKLATTVTYVPKPRPGSISNAEFTRLASLAPEQRKDVLILDVRNPDETKNGTIKGALMIPETALLSRLAEVPKDAKVLVVTHCSTGIRAELAYHLLKEKGYNARFLNAEITIIDTGEFTID
ncbi:MAG: sulfurtransferase [Holophagaceae bacterium]|nr:sulfurtransferase [Holophagaceae bacterium]